MMWWLADLAAVMEDPGSDPPPNQDVMIVWVNLQKFGVPIQIDSLNLMIIFLKTKLIQRKLLQHLWILIDTESKTLCSFY